MKKFLLALVVFSITSLQAQQEVVPQDFSLPQFDGKMFNLKDVLGKKLIVMNFWASWCKTCSEEIPELAKFQKSIKPEDVIFLGINTGENESKALKFQKREGYPYFILIDKDKTVAKKYNVVGLPQTIIICKDGNKIIYRGSRPPKNLDDIK